MAQFIYTSTLRRGKISITKILFSFSVLDLEGHGSFTHVILNIKKLKSRICVFPTTTTTTT
jgi:hypothetical protein